MEMGRGGACMPTRVALQGRIHRSIPRAPCVYFCYGNAAARHVAPQGRIHRSIPTHNARVFIMETPLRGRSGGHTGAAPTVSFGQIARRRLISFGMDCAWAVGFVGVDCM